jgi:hypothetical protein
LHVVKHLYYSIKQFIKCGSRIVAAGLISRDTSTKGQATVTTCGTGDAVDASVALLQNGFFTAATIAVKLVNQCRGIQSTVETLLTFEDRALAAK